MEKMKRRIRENLESLRAELCAMSDTIHQNPELGFEEYKASALLCDRLEQAGFSVTRGVAGLPTAFVAEYAVHRDGPVIALVAEYDALPEIGHGCGHQIIATAPLGASIALMPLMEELHGTLRVIGTPAEETGAGKVTMLRDGVFSDVDFAMQCHPNDRTMTDARFKAVQGVDFLFHGVSSHASRAPEKGISALDAVMIGYTSVEYLKEHLRRDASVAGIVTNGGTATNSIPDFASARYTIRSNDSEGLEQAFSRVCNCYRGAEIATGARLEIREGMRLDSSLLLPTLNRLLMENAVLSGAEQILPQETMASTDFCNVTRALPAARLDIAFAPVGTSTHSQAFADAGTGPMAHRALITAAFAMAATAADLWQSPALAAAVRAEFDSLQRPADPVQP